MHRFVARYRLRLIAGRCLSSILGTISVSCIIALALQLIFIAFPGLFFRCSSTALFAALLLIAFQILREIWLWLLPDLSTPPGLLNTNHQWPIPCCRFRWNSLLAPMRKALLRPSPATGRRNILTNSTSRFPARECFADTLLQQPSRVPHWSFQCGPSRGYFLSGVFPQQFFSTRRRGYSRDLSRSPEFFTDTSMHSRKTSVPIVPSAAAEPR